ncbi:MAG: helix-turn-helix transcriptional regulator [Verrucomicrobiia bacterium]
MKRVGKSKGSAPLADQRPEGWFFEPRAENWLDLHFRPVLIGQDNCAGRDFHMDGTTAAIDRGVMWHYSLKGYGLVELGGRKIPLTEGMVLVAFEPGRWKMSLPKASRVWKRLFIKFSGGLGYEALSWMARRHGPVHFLPVRSKAVRQALKLAQMGDDGCKRSSAEWSLAVYEWLMYWVDEATSLAFPTEVPDKEVLQSPLLGVGFSSFKEYAERVGYSRSHLSRKLSRDWGKSPGAALRRSRLAQAARLLRNFSMPISEVALRVAYSSPTSFIRAFRAVYGVTPFQYRMSKAHHAEDNVD